MAAQLCGCEFSTAQEMLGLDDRQIVMLGFFVEHSFWNVYKSRCDRLTAAWKIEIQARRDVERPQQHLPLAA